MASKKSSFDYYLSQIDVSAPTKIYTFPTASGKFEINNKKDQANFLTVYNTAMLHRGIGNGELAIKWLFQNAKENHGGHKSDFIINGSEVEVKSYPSHTAKMTLGKFKSDTNSRYLINSIFSLYNIINYYPEFYSETCFNVETVRNSFDLLISAKSKTKKHEEVMLYVTGSTSKEMAINTMNNLFRTKLEQKPGHNNYIVNVTPKDPLNIYVFKVDIGKLNKMTYSDWIKYTDIQSSELRLNMSLFL